VVRSPRLKFWKFLGGGGIIEDPLEWKILGSGGVQIKMSAVGGMDIFWNHIIPINPHLYFLGVREMDCLLYLFTS